MLAYYHPITHNSNSPGPRIDLPANLNADGVMPDFLHPLPNCFRAGMAIALACQETSEAGNQAHHVTEFWRLGGWLAAFFDKPRGLPFLGIEHHAAGQGIHALASPHAGCAKR